MLRNFKNTWSLSILLLVACFQMIGQNSTNLWSSSIEKHIENEKQFKKIAKPLKYQDFKLNLSALKNNIQKAPIKKGLQSKSETVISFPNGEGGFESYAIFETSVLNEKLQQEYPTIKTYYGVSETDKENVIRFSISTMGFHGMILKKGGDAVFIDPVEVSGETYMVYNRKDNVSKEQFQCNFDELSENISSNKVATYAKETNADDGKLRKFRLAVAATGEYSQFHINNQNIAVTASDLEKRAAVMSAIVTTINRVNGLYERDLGITMELVADNSKIIFLDATTDNLTNDNTDNKLLDESQTVIDANIGFANYDIGHTFSTGAGGVAVLNSPCTSAKAKGITGTSTPIGDSFNIDFVAHEMGHQFGAHHTFSGDSGNCSGDNRYVGTAVEPGSGTTIMAYAGLCPPQNVENTSDAYFHLISIKEIWSNITIGSGKCAALIETGNVAPVVEGFGNYTIPISTPFVLKATATDANNDNLTYTWEQLDAGAVSYPLVSTIASGSVFRSLPPSTSAVRYFPEQSTVNAGLLSSTWEVLPSVARTMRFGVTVRDNNSVGGQTASKEINLTVDGSSGPFVVTSQQQATTWYAGTSQTVTWDVAKTNVAPVACAKVSIFMSKDGGLTYPTTLASEVSNNGSYAIVVPNEVLADARIKIQSEGNVFYAVNKGKIKVETSEFILDFEAFNKEVCVPNNAMFNFNYKSFFGFSEAVTFSTEGLPSGATVVFSPTSAITNDTPVQMTISGITIENVGSYQIVVKGKSVSLEKSTTVNLGVFSSVIKTPELISPATNFIDFQKPFVLSWGVDINAIKSTVQIATDAAFTTLVEAAEASNGWYNPKILAPLTTYYWRVKNSNNCGQSSYSEVYKFTTINETCGTVASVDIPKKIPDNLATGISSIISSTENKKITKVEVKVKITHQWVGDLSLYLISPSGTIVQLSEEIGEDGSGYDNTTFDDDAATSVQLGVAPYVGTYRPQNSLSKFNGENSIGNWSLKVVDGGFGDIGNIVSWSIEICGNPVPVAVSETNFTVISVGETCTGKNNGQLIINTDHSLTYNVTVNGNVYEFTGKSYIVENLAPGTYPICVNVKDDSTKYCYIAEIVAGTKLSAKASVSDSAVFIEVEEGTAPYGIYVNNEFKFETTETEFEVFVTKGDVVEVKSAQECEGIFLKKIGSDQLVAFPNPTAGDFEILIPSGEKEVTVAIFNTFSQLISKEVYPIILGKAKVSIANKPKGMYLAVVYLKIPKTIKVLKQ